VKINRRHGKALQALSRLRFSSTGMIPERYREEVRRNQLVDNARSFPVVLSGALVLSILIFAQYSFFPPLDLSAPIREGYVIIFATMAALSLVWLPVVFLSSRMPVNAVRAAIGMYFLLLLTWSMCVSFLDLATNQGWDALIIGIMVYAVVYRSSLRNFLFALAWILSAGTAILLFFYRGDPNPGRFLQFYLYCFVGILFAVQTESTRVETAILRAGLRDSNEELRTLAILDPLTKMYNRRYLNEYLAHQVPLARRLGQSISFLSMDLDRFKDINDRFGHPEGDRIIVKTSDLIRTSVREYDLLFRYGGEEFLVVLVNTEMADALEIAERIRENVEQGDFGLSDRKVTLSIGLSAIPADGDLQSALSTADHRLYAAKAAGRNRCVAV